MDKKTLGYVIQLAGLVALAVVGFYAAAWARALLIAGIVALPVGRYVRMGGVVSGKSEG